MYKLPLTQRAERRLFNKFINALNTISKPSDKYRELSKIHWDSIAKPLDSLGEFEKIFQKFSAITEREIPLIDKKAVIVICGDNGIVEEGISQSGKEVTLAVAKSMARGTSSIAVMSKALKADLLVVDMGIDSFDTEIYSLGVLDYKLMHGSNNFLKEKAMPFDITLRAVLNGISLVEEQKKRGINLIGTGEMGIGNTTTSCAICGSLLDVSVKEITGRGAGLDDERLLKKIQVIDQGIDKYKFKDAEFIKLLSSHTYDRGLALIDLLSSLGGLDIAGLVGVFLGGAIYKVPVVIDGVISQTAALTAYYLNPYCKEYMIASHLSKEPVAGLIFDILNLQPVICGNLSLGEGSGCALLFPLLDLISDIYSKNASFSDINIEDYKRFSV